LVLLSEGYNDVIVKKMKIFNAFEVEISDAMIAAGISHIIVSGSGLTVFK